VNNRDIPQICDVKPLLDRRFLLGESPGYDERTDSVFWVDIKTGSFFLWNRKIQNLREIQTGQYLGAIVPTKSGGYLAAMTTGIYKVDDRGLAFICRPVELRDNLRINDAKCDPAGRFWFGTMGLFETAPEGSLFRLDPDGSCRKMLSGPKVSNGLAWSLDGKIMYYIDSSQNGVDAFDYDLEFGIISNRHRIISFSDQIPDGMTIDGEGKLWIALWGSSKVVRCDPGEGSIIGEIIVPSVNTSSCCFAGKNLDTLVITTSGEGFDDPLAGCVFYAEPGIRGTPTQIFGG
jgi:sugar lactone lactonase YvrE